MENKAKEQMFTVDELRRDCLKLFGVTQSTFDGAVYDLEGEFTVGQMRSHIKKWQDIKVYTGNIDAKVKNKSERQFAKSAVIKGNKVEVIKKQDNTGNMKKEEK